VGALRTVARRLAPALVVVAAVTGACTGSSSDDTEEGARPIPAPVEVRQEPDGVTLADPAFEALPGARAEFGRLGGAVYQLEVPERWNERLVLWMHGFEEFGPEASVSAPDIRAYLIAHGYAWGASSLSGTGWIPGREADETAAVWDLFTERHGRPDRTYVVGLSMGGAAAHIAAERHPERFDGALALCGSAGATSGLQNPVDVFLAGALAAGVTQEEHDATGAGDLIRARIRPALREPAARERFERTMVELSGGPRPFAREGLRLEEETDWRRAGLAVAAGVVPPQDPSRFDAGAVRLRTDEAGLQAYVADNEASGALRIPLLTMHTTGDGQVPIEEARILRRRVDAAAEGDLLVQRTYRDPGHCGFTTVEQVASFEDLVAWAERGRRPAGHDLLTVDLAAPEPALELTPRPGTPEADAVPGAEERIVLRGTATVDGAPLEARFFGAEVVRDGRTTHCQLDLASVVGGAFEVTVLGDREAAGCGAPGSDVVLWTYVGTTDVTQLHATTALPWPGVGTTTTADVAFSTAAPDGVAAPVASFGGEALDAGGDYVPPATLVEAFVGRVRCGVASTRRTGSFSGYSIAVAGPEAVRGCRRGAEVSFRVDGRRAAQTATNDVDGSGSSLDLTT
jgi:pimeloyl-ACP methyl ester carboxylesterase